MILMVFAVRDKQVDAFLQPFFSPTMGSALRSIKTVLADPNHDFHKNVQDFSLYKLAEFDDSTGRFSGDSPEYISLLTALMPTTP